MWSWRFFLILSSLASCGLSGLAAFAVETPPSRDFWVWDLTVMPPGHRKITAELKAAGDRSLIYVEPKLWEKNITPGFVNRLRHRLEKEAPANAIFPNKGIVPLEETLYAPLPRLISSDDRVIILFADLGQYKQYSFDGFFNSFDQMKSEDAEKQGEYSNQGNIIYINGLRQNEEYTTAVIAHELQHLLNFQVGPREGQDLWLSEVMGESAMLVNGYSTDQGHANTFASQPQKYPLVSHQYVQYGPQLLFSAFLLDSMPNKQLGLSFLSSRPKGGREAVEALFQKDATRPISFDLVFSNFLSYLFEKEGKTVPYTIPKATLQVPNFISFAKIAAYPGEVEGRLMPYTFLTVDLPEPLPPSSLVQVDALRDPSSKGCASDSSLLWKPLGLKRLAVYSVGCENSGKNDEVKFRLRILNRPLLLPPSPLRIGL